MKGAYISNKLVLLLTITLLSGMTLASARVSADDTSVVDEINITVPIACTMSGTGMQSHNANINNGLYEDDIGSTVLHAFCNDNEGFAIYAAGYTGNEVGGTNSNKLVGTTASGNATIESGIATGPVGSNDISNWAMKLTMTQDSGDTSTDNAFTIDSAPNVALPSQAESGATQAPFSDYHTVPNEYTKVAHKNSGTDMTETTGGVKLTTTYAAYISKTQPADTYSGQVKYILVHPSSHARPDSLYGVTMQTVSEWGRKLDVGQSTVAIDERDGSEYTVARLVDKKIWMTKNMRLDFATANITAENTNNPTADFIAEASEKPRTNNDTWCSIWRDECNNHIQFSTINLGDDRIDEDGNTYDDYGVYYNWYTATAGNGTNETLNYTTVNGDLCPNGWHLPIGGYDSGDYIALANVTKQGNEAATSAANAERWMAEPIAMVKGGTWLATSSFSDVSQRGENGGYWTGTSYDIRGKAVYLTFPALHQKNYGNGDFNYGNAVRCLANLQSYPLKASYDDGVMSILVDGNTISDGATVNFTEGTSHTVEVVVDEENYHFVRWSAESGTFGNDKSESTTYEMGHTPIVLRAITEERTDFDEAYGGANKTKYQGYYKMQDMNASICDAVTVDSTGTLIDVRDDNIYSVKKLADDRCWMTKNLRLDIGNATINASNTNNPTSGFLNALSTAASSENWCGNATAECVDQVLYNTGNIGNNTVDSTNHTYDSYGVYYNWFAATAGNGTFATSANAAASGDICPSGWHLPSGILYNGGGPSIWSGDYWNLAVNLAGLQEGNVQNSDYNAITSVENMIRIRQSSDYAFSGLFYPGTQGASYLGSGGCYWSSMSTPSDGLSEGVYLDSSSGSVFYTQYRYFGLTMRCLAND